MKCKQIRLSYLLRKDGYYFMIPYALSSGCGGASGFMDVGGLDFLGLAGGGGGGGNCFSPSFTILGGVNFIASTFGGGGGAGLPSLRICLGGGGGGGNGCDFLLLFTTTGMASGPFSTMGLADFLGASCAWLNRPMPNRQNTTRLSFSFIWLFTLRCQM